MNVCIFWPEIRMSARAKERASESERERNRNHDSLRKRARARANLVNHDNFIFIKENIEMCI